MPPRSPFSAVVPNHLKSGLEPAPVCSHPCLTGSNSPQGPGTSVTGAACLPAAPSALHVVPDDNMEHRVILMRQPWSPPLPGSLCLPRGLSSRRSPPGTPFRLCSPGLASPHANGRARRLPSSTVSLPQVHARHFLTGPSLTARRSWFVAVSLPRRLLRQGCVLFSRLHRRPSRS